MTKLLIALQQFIEDNLPEVKVNILMGDRIWPAVVKKDFIGLADGIVDPRPHGGPKVKTRDETLEVTIIAAVPIVRQDTAKTGGAKDRGVLWYIEQIKNIVQNENVDGYEFLDFGKESPSTVLPFTDKNGEVKETWLVKAIMTRWESAGQC